MTVPLPPAATSKSNTSASEWLLTLLTSVLILPLFLPSSPLGKAMIVLGHLLPSRCFAKYWHNSAGFRLIWLTSWNKHDKSKSSWTQNPLLIQTSRMSRIHVDMESFLFTLLLLLFFWRSSFAFKILICRPVASTYGLPYLMAACIAVLKGFQWIKVILLLLIREQLAAKLFTLTSQGACFLFLFFFSYFSS